MHMLPLVGALIALFAASAAGQSITVASTQGTLRIPKIQRAPKLSDFLEGVPREDELVVTDFRQFMPGDGSPVSQPTTAYLSYDDHNLYLVFICKDDPKLIRARVAKREQIMSDDRFNICLDTFHTHRHMYWFDINPYGVQADGNVTDGVEDDPSWDTLWHSEARITDDGYVGFVSIPFKSIRFPAQNEQTWGLILGRWIMRNNEYAMWPEVSRKRPGFVQQGGDMSGLEGISPGRNIQLIAYGMLARARFLDENAAGLPQFSVKKEVRGGLDSKLVLKDAFTLDVTLNPDFSQVESDEPQVTVNQRFEVFYPEKRPFFMENAGYFKTPQRLFFSRRIADPRLGARLTGRVGRWSVGALAVDDRAPGERVRLNDALRGREAAVGVVRVQRDFFRNSNAAAMVTSEDFGPMHNRVFSFDTRLQVLPNWIVVSQLMTSDTRLRDDAKLSGPAYFASLEHAGKHFVSESSYTDRSPNFRADLGFVNRVDMREAKHAVGYRWRPETGVVQWFGPKLEMAVNYDRLGRVQDWYVSPEFDLALTRLTKLEVSYWQGYELFANHGFRKRRGAVEFSSEWRKWLALNASWEKGGGVNYYPAAGLAPFLGGMHNASAGFILRPGPRLRIDQNYIFSSLRTVSTSSLPFQATLGAGIYNNHIFRNKINYQFNRIASVRVICDYNSILPNSSLVSLEKSKHIGWDALFTYMVNPGTALHAGYTELYDNLRIDPTLSPALRRTTFPDLNTGRQVFVKLSYLFRF
jgi:hypothetical protein